MKYILSVLIALHSLISASFGYDDPILECGKDRSEFGQFEIEYINQTFTYRWYSTNLKNVKLGPVEVHKPNYLFWGDKYYGMVFSAVGKDNINKLLRYYTNDLLKSWEGKPSEIYFKDPVKREDNSWVLLKPDKVVVIRRHSVHLASVELLCKDVYQEVTGIKLPEN